MKKSIRARLVLTLTLMMIITIFGCWYMNKSFLPSYYQYNKLNTLKKTYGQVKILVDNYTNDSDSTELFLQLDKLNSEKNISIYIISLTKVNISGNTRYLHKYIYPNALYGKQENILLEQLQGMERDKKILYTNAEYDIYKSYDERLSSYSMDLFGDLEINDELYVVYMRTNYQSMKENVAISNQFLAYVGIVAVLIGVIVMFIVSSNFTKPILKLADIAKKMSDLDFDTKYIEVREDEIGELGNSINILSEKLENTISELKTANNELKKDIEQKTQIDEMRKEFLSNVSHELKTPIALIQGYAEGLKENINDDQESRDFYCEVIMDEANKMNNMVKKLLSLNQLEFGSNTVSMERFNIVDVIKSVIASTEILFQQKEAALIFEQEEPIYVWADEYMVEEVLTNYISNALNHVDGERIIEIKLIQKDDVVRISVFNTGKQIPEDDIDKVWIKFYKVDKARTREYGGSGIGLSIVKAIMTSHNKECGVVNRENGVEFWCELDTKMEE